MQIGPWPGLGRGTGEGGRIPAIWLAVGEGKVAREVNWTETNLLVGSGWKIAERTVLVGVEQSSAAEVDGDGGAPVRGGLEREPGELRWREVELLGCSEGAERHWVAGPWRAGARQRRRRGGGDVPAMRSHMGLL